MPFGLAEQRCSRSSANVLKGVRAGIRDSDYVLLWAGSILDWQDPQTLVRAVADIARRRDDVKVFFMGTRHPNPQVPRMRAVDESRIPSQRVQVFRHARRSTAMASRARPGMGDSEAALAPQITYKMTKAFTR
ncbi:MAG: hypothetical protein EXQ50_10875 [Acidobacteria bacterium]|nr:hypothetical protein [Acidobacteriota bacterium]